MAAPALRRAALWVAIAAAASAVLTWIEWAEHRPPHLGIIEAIHFAFVLAVIALGAGLWRMLRKRG